MYLRNGVYWYRIWTPLGASKRVSLETRDAKTAQSVEAWANDVRERLDRHGVLAAVVEGLLSLPQAFVLGETDAARYVAAQRAEVADRPLTDADLDAWGRWLHDGGMRADGIAAYRRQVGIVWPAPRRVSWLTPRAITAAIDAVDVSVQTRGRYRTAMASLCEWLVRQGFVDTNPMPSVPGYKTSTPREVWYSTPDALKVLHALPPVQRGVEALMWACGWELAAVRHATVGDIDLKAMTAYARGTKTSFRQRLTVITEADAAGMIEVLLHNKLPSAPLLDSRALTPSGMLDAHNRAVTAVGLPKSTMHDWRHTFAVKEIKKGRPLEFVAQMLGHANTLMVQKCYGKYRMASDDLARFAAQPRHSNIGTG
jgi:integrase